VVRYPSKTEVMPTQWFMEGLIHSETAILGNHAGGKMCSKVKLVACYSSCEAICKAIRSSDVPQPSCTKKMDVIKLRT